MEGGDVLESRPPPFNLKVGYHTESRCQHQPASFSSAFKLSGTACLVGVGFGCVWLPPKIGDM